MTDRFTSFNDICQDDVQGFEGSLGPIYQAWADQGAFLKSLYFTPRPAPVKDPNNMRTPPSGHV